MVVRHDRESRRVHHLSSAAFQRGDQVCRSTVCGDPDPKSAEHIGGRSAWRFHDQESSASGGTCPWRPRVMARSVDDLGGTGEQRRDPHHISDHHNGRGADVESTG
jgi:hypothetical protein